MRKKLIKVGTITILATFMAGIIFPASVPTSNVEKDNQEQIQDIYADEEQEKSTAIPTAILTENPTEVLATPTKGPSDELIVPTSSKKQEKVKVPSTVDVLVYELNGLPWAITDVEGKTMLQLYGKGEELLKEWELPKDILRAKNMKCKMGISESDDILVRAYFDDNTDSESYLVYYETSDGKYLYFECVSDYMNEEKWLIATADGKAVVYTWGEDKYSLQDFAGRVEVDTIESINFFVLNGVSFMVKEIGFWDENMNK